MSEPETLPKDWFRGLAHAAGPPRISGRIKTCPEDFEVREELGFEPEGAGNHTLLLVRKRQYNTMEVARMLAQFAGVPLIDVGFCGLKDRNAVAYQWFSVRLGKRASPNWAELNSPRIRIVKFTRHRRKLKRGTHRANRFQLIVRQLSGDPDDLSCRLLQLRRHGVPNYFGEQRFGKHDSNLVGVVAMFARGKEVSDSHRRGLYLSAARSFLFNQILSARLDSGSWRELLPGEAVMLEGSRSYFRYTGEERGIAERLNRLDIHPSGALWGSGERPVSGLARTAEDSAVANYTLLRDGLEAFGLGQERRALRACVTGLDWEFGSEDSVKLTMRLHRGVYATAVLRECITQHEYL